ncbi:nucleoside-diphosphate sugar epimerase [Flavobacterium enshiense DK69]|uniref:NAD-dependent epimerase n=1 Tax=Flavobacterium enshiense DK69 TaxID=1107311 RepID=V6S7V2_9FLAO|nr:TIGR01777 family oxidoreductase [Flavobacterium enshiense]ESU22763.1 nucleoside-diphosphate sugar epimerase [Flavobacterium enshiense DK69]KGO95547.1 NAD-dependent epimerase [Flavobacterium enshiense DK69]
MKVLVTGATGLIGKELVSLLLQNGIVIHYLTTSAKKIESEPNYHGFFWDPQKGVIDENCLLGVDAIIHLAGASIAKRWTDSYKQEIIESRILTANLLYNVLKNNPNQVKQIVSASAIGIYPSSLTELYTEENNNISPTFLGSVVEKWEKELEKFRRLNITVCKLRIGLVLANEGGALPQMAKPIKSGMGAAFGTGKQMQSWIHIHDLVAMFLYAIRNSWSGVYNAVAPHPVTNSELVKAIAEALDKDIIMPNVPQILMKLVLGEMNILLYESQNVSSQKALNAGFQYKFKILEKALDNLFV